MMDERFNNRFRATAHTLLRIAAGATFFSHGAQKLLGWFGGVGPDGGTVRLLSEFGAAGVIELVGGILIVVGLFTRPVAFIASGEMAVAYFWKHWARSGEMFWWENRGEVVMLYCFLWFLFAIVFGIGIGGAGTSESPLIARLFGLSSHGLIYGVVGLSWTLGGAIGPFITGYMCDVFQNYQLAFLLCAVIGIIGIIFLLILRPTNKRGISL